MLSSESESKPDPSSADADIAANTASIFSAVTPDTPIRANDSGVSAGLAVPPAAVSNKPATTPAIADNSAKVLTSLDDFVSSTSSMSNARAELLISISPSAAYCDAESVTLLLSTPSAPTSAAIWVALIARAGLDAVLKLEAASDCFAVNEWALADNVATAKDHVPFANTVVVPTEIAPSNISSDAPASPEPVNVGLSEKVVISDIVGAFGATVSIDKVAIAESVLVLPATSVAAAVTL